MTDAQNIGRPPTPEVLVHARNMNFMDGPAPSSSDESIPTGPKTLQLKFEV